MTLIDPYHDQNGEGLRSLRVQLDRLAYKVHEENVQSL